ncbi:MAG TPA: hypothetical protein VG778_06210 [Blastocatellia bacterium]|nr:hypothetical protein [Blastocatellia bacterium]
MRISIIVTMLAVTLAATLSHSVDARQENRAQELIAKARAALGGDAKLAAVQSLSTTAKLRKVLAKDQPQVSGEIQVDMLLPDKYMTSETTVMPVGGVEITRINGLNGDQTFADSKTTGGGGMVIIRTTDANPQMQAARLRTLRAEFARLTIALLLAAPQSQAVELSYFGEAQADEGKADVIDYKFADGFSVRLFLDKDSHKPLMLTYRAAQPQMMMRTQTSVAANREEADKLVKEAQDKAKKEAEVRPEPKMVEMNLYLSDYRKVDGILLPHSISRSVEGEVAEEWEVTGFKINPPLKAEKFKK